MNEQQILFRAPMVRAILEGRKTMTRRAVKPQPESHCWQLLMGYSFSCKVFDTSTGFAVRFQHSLHGIGEEPLWVNSPYGKPGDRLWVREPARVLGVDNFKIGLVTVEYLADEYVANLIIPQRLFKNGHLPDWAFYAQGMPNGCYREASRVTLEITGVRVERLQDISEADAEAEGSIPCVYSWPEGVTAAQARDVEGLHRNGFRNLWDSINGKTPGKSWADSPWVWVVEFKRVNHA